MEGQAAGFASASDRNPIQRGETMQPIKLIERLAKYVLAVLAAAVLWRPNRARLARNAVHAPRRILLVRIDNRIGEALLSTPLLTTLKTFRPLPEVHVLVHPAVVRVLKDHPDLDQVVPLHRALATPGTLIAEIRSLRRAGYDLIFDCGNWSDPSITSAIVARLAAGRRPVIGPAVWPSTWLHSLSVRPQPGVASEITQRLHLLSIVPGLQPNESISFRKPVVRSSFKPFLERLQTRRFAVINPGGRLGWRRVPAEVFSSVAKALLSSGVQPVITFGPGEEGLAKRVASGAEGSLLAPPTDLDELAALMEFAQISLCNNSGPMHLSVAVGTPTLGLFVKMDLRRWGHPNPPHRMLDLTTELASIPRACELVAAQAKELLNSLGEGRLRRS